MKLTLKDIASSEQALTNLLEQKPPAIASYKIQRALRHIIPEIELFSKTRDELVQKYGKPIEGQPGAFKIAPEFAKQYEEEMTTLINQELELDLHPIPLSDLKTLDIQVRDMLLLDYLIVDDVKGDE